VPRDSVHAGPRRRLLHHTVLRAERADRHPVLGVVLAQRRRQSGSRLHRPADRADDDHPVDVHQRVAAARLVRQGDRRVDVDVSGVRVRGAARVRARQRARSAARHTHHTLDTAARPARPPAAGRRHLRPAAAARAREPRGEPTRPGLHVSPHIVTSANEVLFSSASVCLFVSRITRKLDRTDFHRIRWKCATWATEETMIRFWW